MLVVDASCVAEVLLPGPAAGPVASRLAAESELHAPHLLDAEVLRVLRRALRRGIIDASAAAVAVTELEAWPAQRVDHRPLLRRAWSHRENLTAPDALYVALAELLGATLLTLDSRVARAPGLACAVQVP